MKKIAVIILMAGILIPSAVMAKKKNKKNDPAKIVSIWSAEKSLTAMSTALKMYNSRNYSNIGNFERIAFIDIDEDGIPEAAVQTEYGVGAIFGMGDGHGSADMSNIHLIATDGGHGPDIKIYPESHIVALCSDYAGYSHTYHIVSGSYGKGTYEDTKSYGLDDASGSCFTYTSYTSGPLSSSSKPKTVSHEEVLKNVQVKGKGYLLADLNWQPIGTRPYEVLIGAKKTTEEPSHEK